MMYHDRDWYWRMYDGWWGSPHFWVLGIIVIILAALFLYLLVTTSRQRNRFDRETPIEILKRRYANGELSTEEFEERKRILEM